MLEIGAGYFSTPYMHYMAVLGKRKLVTYETDEKLYRYFLRYENEYHSIIFVSDWDSIDISGEWSVALIDHAPDERRVVELLRLKDSCEYLVVHDTEAKSDRKYHFSEAFKSFKHRIDFTRETPNTTIVSNLKNLDDFIV